MTESPQPPDSEISIRDIVLVRLNDGALKPRINNIPVGQMAFLPTIESTEEGSKEPEQDSPDQERDETSPAALPITSNSVLAARERRLGTKAALVAELTLQRILRLRNFWLGTRRGNPVDTITLLPGESVKLSFRSQYITSKETTTSRTVVDAASKKDQATFREELMNTRTRSIGGEAGASYGGLISASVNANQTVTDVRSVMSEQISVARAERRIEFSASTTNSYEETIESGIERVFSNPNVDIPVAYTVFGSADSYLSLIEVEALDVVYRSADGTQQLVLPVPVPTAEAQRVPRWSEEKGAFDRQLNRLIKEVTAGSGDENEAAVRSAIAAAEMMWLANHTSWLPITDSAPPEFDLSDETRQQLVAIAKRNKDDSETPDTPTAATLSESGFHFRLDAPVLDSAIVELPTVAGTYVEAKPMKTSAFGKLTASLYDAQRRERTAAAEIQEQLSALTAKLVGSEDTSADDLGLLRALIYATNGVAEPGET